MQTPGRSSEKGVRLGPLWLWALALVCVVLGFIRIVTHPESTTNRSASASRPGDNWTASTHLRKPATRPATLDSRPPGEIVAEKVIQFAKSRRAITRAMARQLNLLMPAEVEAFYDAAESGRWDDLKAAFLSLQQSKQAEGEKAEQLNRIFGPIHETFGVAEVAHDWPAQELLDYGQAVLGSLRPGMVYSGGTDAGRFIPTLLNGAAGDPNIVITQNALADNTYREYVDFLYRDRVNTLSKDDSDRVFQEYMADAQKRLQHDQEFPNEPKQLRPGEDVRLSDGRLQVSGQVAVMSINERLFQQIMDKNPSLSFAMEQSFPFKSTYANAAPLGPVMELNVPAEHPFSSQAADQTIDYWNTTVQQLLDDPDVPAGSEPRKAWSKMVVSQADLLANRSFSTQADQAYALAVKLAPESPEAVFSYVNLLLKNNRAADAQSIVANAARLAPENDQFRQLLDQVNKLRQSGR